MYEIERLLADVSAISKKYDLLNKKTGGYFNIFDIADIATNEITICRIIHELINRNGSHYQGDKYLRLFVKYVLQMQFSDEEYKTVNVCREHVIDHKRRIDLFIKTTNHSIPIEVKIYAEDQPNQCLDYYKRAKNSNLFYLTLYGDKPSNINEEDLKVITIISFSKDIIYWLTKCLEQKDTIRIAPIREIILQLIAVLRRLTDQLEEGMGMEIQQFIMSSKENMFSAMEIERSLRACKTEMIRKVFNAIEQGLGKEKIINEYDYEANNSAKVNNYYDYKGSTYPGISYPYKQNVKKDVDIWFRIEIDRRLFAGFCVPYHKKSDKQMLTKEEIQKFIPSISEARINNWWAYWEHLPNKDNTPNFKNFDSGNLYFQLFDQCNFDNFINKCLEKIKQMYE